MITQKTKEEIEILREGGRRLAFVLEELKKKVTPGVSLESLDDEFKKLTEEKGDRSPFLNYTQSGTLHRPFPASICISINDEIVHGVPNEGGRILKKGDVVTLDGGLNHKHLIVDSAITVAVGEVSSKVKKLIEITQEALYAGIKKARVGNKVGDISNAIEEHVRPYGFAIYKDLVGHGVGYSVHEEPYIPNVGKAGTGPELKEGMVLAIEPMLGLGSNQIILSDDKWTYRTKDGSTSAHFEHTIVITKDGPEVLTKM